MNAVAERLLHADRHLARARAGLPGVLIHDLRRTAVRDMRRLGLSETTIMAMVGHRTRSMHRRYDIISDGDLLEAAARLPGEISASDD